MLHKRILDKLGGLEREILDFVTKVEAVQLFLGKHGKSESPRSDVRELLAKEALEAIPVDKLEDFLSRYKAKIQWKEVCITGNARIVPDEKTRTLFEEITSRRRWLRSFAYFAKLSDESDLDIGESDLDDSGPQYLGGMKKFLKAKKLITRDGKLTPQGKRIVSFFKDEINAKIKKKRAKPRESGTTPQRNQF